MQSLSTHAKLHRYSSVSIKPVKLHSQQLRAHCLRGPRLQRKQVCAAVQTSEQLSSRIPATTVQQKVSPMEIIGLGAGVCVFIAFVMHLRMMMTC